jgi:hypothetical protein
MWLLQPASCQSREQAMVTPLRIPRPSLWHSGIVATHVLGPEDLFPQLDRQVILSTRRTYLVTPRPPPSSLQDSLANVHNREVSAMLGRAVLAIKALSRKRTPFI